MALFDIIPELVNCGEQGLNSLMDKDWNHWKLQLQSWMKDAEEADAQARANGGTTTCGPPPTCGSGARQNRGCPASSSRFEENNNPLEVLHQMWTQFARPQQQRTAEREASNNLVKNEQRKFVIKLDVQNFEPNEISVKILDKDIIVDGEHQERTDRLGRVSRKFQRKYELPEDVEPNTIISTLTPSGVLIIEGLKKNVPKEDGGEIIIPVIREQTNSAEEANNYENDQKMD